MWANRTIDGAKEVTVAGFTAARRGRMIMRGYRHPDDWENGDIISTHRLAGMFVLRISEVVRGPMATVADLEARANIAALRAWAEYTNLVTEGEALIIQVSAKDAYFAVPRGQWRRVMSVLQTL